MNTLELVVFWSVIILLLAFTLTTGRERWNFVKGIYTRFVDALKNRDYMHGIVSGDMRKGKTRIGTDDISADPSHNQAHQKANPKARNQL